MSETKKPFWKKWWVWVIGVILLIGIAGASGGDESTKPTATTPQSAEQNQESAKTEEAKPTTYKLNQEVKVGNLSYVASEIKKTTSIGNEFLNKKTEEQFVLVKVKVKNNDKEARTVDTNLFKVKDNQGREFAADAEADMYVNSNANFFLEQVNPGTSRSGYVVFEIPKDAKGLTMEVSSGLGWSGGDFAAINLGM